VEEIGFAAVTREDDAYLISESVALRHGVPNEEILPLIAGDEVRDWSLSASPGAIWPYDPSSLDARASQPTLKFLWHFRTQLSMRVAYGQSQIERGLEWFEYSMFFRNRFRIPLSITFAFVATHNHFVLDRGGKVFKQSAPVIKLPADSTLPEHLALLGLLNSSVACFWMKQVMTGKHKGDGGSAHADPAYQRFEFSGTQMEKFPIIDEKPLHLSAPLDSLGRDRQQRMPDALAGQLPMPFAEWRSHHIEADRLLREMIALQEELDWRCYRIYGITEDELTYRDASGQPLTPPEIQLGERAFEIVLARRMAAGEEETTWFARHGSTPIAELPAHWPEGYRRLVERRIERIEQDRYVGLVERPEYKRRWNVESWEDQEKRALSGWLLDRLESAAYWPEPRLQTTRELASRAERDADFMAVAELYQGHAGVNVPALVEELVEGEAVPFLPVLRYKESGLRNRAVWEQTWELQRREDAIDARVEKELSPSTGETEAQVRKRVEEEQKRRKAAEVGDIPRPPKYRSADFQNTTYWRLRGPLDVPKERFISYPFCGREGETSLLVGWAGWNHLEQAHAIAGWYNELGEREGWPVERLKPLLAGLAELIPWLKQWHNEVDPVYDQRLGDFYAGFLDGQLHTHGLTLDAVREWTPPAAAGRGRRRAGVSR
jgi:hypothetical protein